MHRYVDNAGLNVDLLDLMNETGNALGDFHAARRNSRQYDVCQLRVPLNDFVRNSSKRSTNCLRVHDRDGGTGCLLFCLFHWLPWRPRRIALKEQKKQKTSGAAVAIMKIGRAHV